MQRIQGAQPGLCYLAWLPGGLSEELGDGLVFPREHRGEYQTEHGRLLEMTASLATGCGSLSRRRYMLADDSAVTANIVLVLYLDSRGKGACTSLADKNADARLV
jgi:hypothetical protein